MFTNVLACITLKAKPTVAFKNENRKQNKKKKKKRGKAIERGKYFALDLFFSKYLLWRDKYVQVNWTYFILSSAPSFTVRYVEAERNIF